MDLPPLLACTTQQEFLEHFVNLYCRHPVTTFDGIQVRFRRDQFYHCCFDSIHTKDDTFSQERAERLPWIKTVLESPDAELRVGWDNVNKRPATNRRVAIILESYIVIIKLRSNGRANFVTAFVDNGRAVAQIRTNPLWK